VNANLREQGLGLSMDVRKPNMLISTLMLRDASFGQVVLRFGIGELRSLERWGETWWNNLRVEAEGLHSVGGEKVEGRARWPVKRQM